MADNNDVSNSRCPFCGYTHLARYRQRADNRWVLHCPRCDLAFVDAYPKNWRDWYSEAYFEQKADSKPHIGYEAYEGIDYTYMLWATALIALTRATGALFDVGCANGLFLDLARNAGFAPLAGAELAPEYAAQAREKGYDVTSGDFLALDTREKYDAVTAWAVIEHIPDVMGALAKMRQLLKPDGLLFFEVPCLTFDDRDEVWLTSSLEHIYYFTEKSLRSMLHSVFDHEYIGRVATVPGFGATIIGFISPSGERMERLRPVASLLHPDTLPATEADPDTLMHVLVFYTRYLGVLTATDSIAERLGAAGTEIAHRYLAYFGRSYARAAADTAAYEGAKAYLTRQVEQRDRLLAEANEREERQARERAIDLDEALYLRTRVDQLEGLIEDYVHQLAFAAKIAALPQIDGPAMSDARPATSVMPSLVSNPAATTRVLFALPFTIHGGANRLFVALADALAAHAFAITVVTTVPLSPEQIENLGDSTDDLLRFTDRVHHLPRLLDEAQWANFLFAEIAARDIRIVYLAGSAFMYTLLPELKRRFPHVMVADQLFNDFAHMPDNRTFADFIDLNITDNATVGASWLKKYGERPERVRIIPTGIDLQHFAPLASDQPRLTLADYPALIDKFVVGFFGRFADEKRPEIIVEIADRLRDRDDLAFIMCGGGPLFAGVRHMVEERGLRGRVHLLGYVPDEEVRRLLGHCHAVVLPSSIEGRPYIAMESLAMGIPVVASHVGGLPDLIIPGGNGELCPAGDPGAFAAALEQMCADPVRHAEMRRNARRFALEHFDIEAMRDAYVAVFRELAAGTPADVATRMGGKG